MQLDALCICQSGAPGHTTTGHGHSASLPTFTAEAGYRSLVEHLPAVTYVEDLDPDGSLRYISPRVQAITGYSPDEWMAGPARWRECLHPEDEGRVLASITEYQQIPPAERGVLALEYRMIARDGRTVWVRDERRVVTDDDGHPLFVQGISLDVTEYKRVEDELRRSEARFRSLVQNVSDVITVYNADGTIRYISPAMGRVLGYDPSGAVGYSAAAVFHPEDRFRAWNLITHAVTHPHEHTPVELRVLHRDGSWRHVEAMAHNLLDEPSVAGIVVITRDITERLAAEAERERLRADALARRREVEILLEISTALNAAENEHEMVHAVAEHVARLCDVVDASVGVLRDGALVFTRRLANGEWNERRYVPPATGSITGHVIATGRSYRSNDLATEPLSDRRTDTELGLRTQLCVPLLGERGDMLGILNMFNKRNGCPFTDHDQALAEAVATEVGVALERAISRAGLTEALDALGQSEARFRSLVQNVSDIITVYDLNGRVQYISPAVERVLGYSTQESLGTDSAPAVHPDDLPAIAGFLTRASTNPDVHTPVQVRLRHRDGSWRYLESVAHNLLHEPSVEGIVVISRDITERMQVEAERERLRADALARRREVEILLEISTALNAAETETEMIEIVGARARSLCGTLSLSVGLCRGDLLDITMFRATGMGHVSYRPPATGSIGSHVLATGRSYRCNDLSTDPITDSASDVQLGLFRQLTVPIIGEGGQVLGLIDLFNKEGDEGFTEHDQVVMEALAAELGVALERARSREEVTEALAALQDSEARFRSLVQNGSDIIVVVNGDGIITYISPSIEQLTGFQPEDVTGTNAYDWVHLEDREEVRQTLLQHLTDPEAKAPTVRASFRLMHKDGSSRSVDMLATNLLHEPSVRGIVINMRDITDRVALEEALSRQAFHDALTGLPNRALFMDRLSHTLTRAGRRFGGVAVLYLDLDGFKVINDSLGHAAGDTLLIAAGVRIAGCVRPSDTVARFGGDEFAVLLEDIEHPDDATTVAARIVSELRRPFTVEGREVFAAASLGITYSDMRHTRPDDLLREADIALYRAKAAGKSQAVVFDPEMNVRALERLEMETDLRRAIERGELYLEYQPLVELRGGTVRGVESLARWRHPVRGLIPPVEFIPIAEETGLILAIGRWSLIESCRQAKEWQSLRPDGPPLVMSVNLSARQFQQPDLVQHVAEVLEETGLPPACLRLEITEGTAMADAESTIRTLTALKALGVQLAIDDFGTGYSSLNYLRRFPVDTLKIDRSFVWDLDHDDKTIAIVRAIIRLSHALGIKVTAEGIETAEQAARLKKMGCDRGQGYHFARPLAPELIPVLVTGGDTHAFIAPRARSRSRRAPVTRAG